MVLWNWLRFSVDVQIKESFEENLSRVARNGIAVIVIAHSKGCL